MNEITDIDDKRISYYRSLRFTPKIHTDNNAFIAEGEKVVVKLLRSDIRVDSIFGTKEILDKYDNLINNKNIPPENILFADIALMKEIVGFNIHSGIMAIGTIPQDTPLKGLASPVIIMNGIANAENVGSIVRNAAAFGFTSIITDEKTVSPWLRRCVRVSMGNIFSMNVYHSTSIIETLNQLRKMGYLLITAEITDNSFSINELNLGNNKYCIIFGSEGRGVSPEIIDMSDKVVHIPINHLVESLNVASSSAVVLNRLSKVR